MGNFKSSPPLNRRSPRQTHGRRSPKGIPPAVIGGADSAATTQRPASTDRWPRSKSQMCKALLTVVHSRSSFLLPVLIPGLGYPRLAYILMTRGLSTCVQERHTPQGWRARWRFDLPSPMHTFKNGFWIARLDSRPLLAGTPWMEQTTLSVASKREWRECSSRGSKLRGSSSSPTTSHSLSAISIIAAFSSSYHDCNERVILPWDSERARDGTYACSGYKCTMVRVVIHTVGYTLSDTQSHRDNRVVEFQCMLTGGRLPCSLRKRSYRSSGCLECRRHPWVER